MGLILALIMAAEGWSAHAHAWSAVDDDGIEYSCLDVELGDLDVQLFNGRRYSPHLSARICPVPGTWSLHIGTDLWCWDKPAVCTGEIRTVLSLYGRLW